MTHSQTLNICLIDWLSRCDLLIKASNLNDKLISPSAAQSRGAVVCARARGFESVAVSECRKRRVCRERGLPASLCANERSV